MDQFSKNILDVLQLYEFSMAIGRSFDYWENCDSLLRLIMARKNLDACWIFKQDKELCKVSFSIPISSKKVIPNSEKCIVRKLHEKGGHFSQPVNSEIISIAPFKLDGGSVAVFNLQNEGLLFFYNSRKNSFSEMEINQLSPIIDKFRVSLEASDVFRKRENLLYSLEKQNKELSDYAHVVSHDLKSPIRNIETLLSWIRQDYISQIDSKGLKTFNMVSDNLERMDSLIDGILKYSTIDKDNTENQAIDLNELVVSIITLLNMPEHVYVHVETPMPIIQGNLFRLQQLFQNLIQNAVKYNDKERCVIRLGSKRVMNAFQFYITDNGIGIEEKYFDKVFQVFQSLDNDPKSSGIGLSVVKKIVESYGGKIWIESDNGIGTTFFFTLSDN